MVESGIYPDFIVVDGKEGGAGVAQLEFTDLLCMTLREGLVFVRDALIGIGARDQIRIGCSGKIVNSYDMVVALARSGLVQFDARFMGCIQSLSCHTDRCPTGVTTRRAAAPSPSRTRPSGFAIVIARC